MPSLVGDLEKKSLRQTMEERDIYRLWREGDGSYDESRHVSPLNRVFLGFELAAAVAGIEFRCGPSLSSARHRWKCSYQYSLSESEYVLIRLIDDFRGPCPLFPSPRSQLINVWVTVVFPYWYGNWWRRSRNKSYWPAGEAPTFVKSSVYVFVARRGFRQTCWRQV